MDAINGDERGYGWDGRDYVMNPIKILFFLHLITDKVEPRTDLLMHCII